MTTYIQETAKESIGKHKTFQQIRNLNDLKTLNKNVQGIQFTLQFSKDDSLFVFEDTMMNRLTNTKNDKIYFFELTSEEIKKNYKYKNGDSISWFDSEFIQKISHTNLLIEIELKEFKDIFKYVTKLLSLLILHPNLKERLILSSINPSILYFLKTKDASIETMLISRRHLISDFFGRNKHEIPSTIIDKPLILQNLIRRVAMFGDFYPVSQLKKEN
eukprot:gene5985-9984_t